MTDLRFNEDELDKICVLKRLESGQLNQLEAAQEMGLSTRQVRRIQKRIADSGN